MNSTAILFTATVVLAYVAFGAVYAAQYKKQMSKFTNQAQKKDETKSLNFQHIQVETN